MLIFVYILGIGLGIYIGYDICLNEKIDKLKRRGDMDGKIYDTNGNPVGSFKLTNR